MHLVYDPSCILFGLNIVDIAIVGFYCKYTSILYNMELVTYAVTACYAQSVNVSDRQVVGLGSILVLHNKIGLIILFRSDLI